MLCKKSCVSCSG
uniref:Uncharacterized protein n=1 Tax=Anguilla anguilla TaxID=7936 RepID=A0A0E9XRM8_ANGAN